MSERPRSPVIPRVWSDDVRRQAYAIFVGAGNGNLSETSRILSQEIGETVALSTVHNWSNTDRWRERVTVERAADTRETMDEYVQRLWVAVPTALSTINDIATGRLSAEPGVPLSLENLNNRKTAAQFIIDKAQALLLKQADSNRKTGRPQQTTSALPSNVSDLDSDGLEQLEQRMRSRTATAD